MAGKSSIKRNPTDTNAYIVGGGVGAMAAAIYLIRDAGVPGKNIHIFETLPIAGGSLDGSGDAKRGFMIRGGRMLNIPTYECLQDIMTTIPSLEFPDMEMEREFLNFNDEFKTHARARLVNADGTKVDVDKMGFSQRDRLDMERLILIENESVLLQRRYNTGYEDGKYCR